MKNKFKNFIKKRWKLLIFILVSIFLIFSINRWTDNAYRLAKANEEIAFIKKSKKNEIKVWKDREGKLHNTVKNLQLEKKQMKSYTQKVEKDLKIKSKQIQKLTKITTETSLDKELTPIYIHDTIKGETIIDSVDRPYKYEDEYATIGVYTKDNQRRISLNMLDTLKTTDYWDRKHFLAPKKFYTDISNASPYVKLNSIQAIERANPRRVKFIVAPAVGVLTNGTQTTVGGGVVVIWYPLSLKIR